MQESHCPLCYEALEVRQVTPCEECGADSKELEHFRDHRYGEYEVFPGLNLVLCNFCAVDFGSYYPTFFGLPKHTSIGFHKMRGIREVSKISLGKDKYCASCGYRLAFLRFVAKAREMNEPSFAPRRRDGAGLILLNTKSTYITKQIF